MINKLVVFFFTCLTLARAIDVVYNQTEEIALDCEIKTGTIVWAKNNKTLVDVSGYKIEDRKLHFQIGRSTLGEYECIGDNGDKSSISLTTTPIMDGENVQQKNAINDETFVYECKGFGNPKPTVTWLKGNTTIESEDDVENPRIIIKNSTDMYNAVIKIKRVQNEDGGEYVCEARNINGVSRTKLIVSIKDKYAALWPFLAICVEVAVLCAIILLVEKKRSKKDEKVVLVDENDKSPNKQSEELRQRK